MKIEIQETEPVDYNFAYKKDSFYKTKALLKTKSNGKFNLKINTDTNLELVFKSKIHNNTISNDPLVFSPVKLNYDVESNLYFIKNKEHIRQQWDRYKEKYRNKSNLATLLLFERLYFYIPLGLEYDLLSNGAYLPFFLNIYDQELQSDTVYAGMNWVHSPLNLPLKINYEFDYQRENVTYFGGQVILDDQKLAKLIADKHFQKHLKPYHYTKDFTIESDVKIAYNTETGYIISSLFWLKIYSKAEEINEEIEFEVVQDKKENLLAFHSSKQNYKSNLPDSPKRIEEKEAESKRLLVLLLCLLLVLFMFFGALLYLTESKN